jgi:hypothetical protein
MAYEQVKLREILERAVGHSWSIPEFQRGFVRKSTRKFGTFFWYLLAYRNKAQDWDEHGHRIGFEGGGRSCCLAFQIRRQCRPSPGKPMHANPLETTLRSIARLEEAKVREPRLTEPDHARWHRFRRKLGWRAFIEILHEDLAGAFPIPFDLARWPTSPLSSLTEAEAEQLIADAARSSATPVDPTAFLYECARSLGLPTSGTLSGLPKVQPHHRILELPGSGGLIAAVLCVGSSGLAFNAQFTFVAETTAEHVAIGLAAVELRANEPRILTLDALRAALKGGETFDRAFGLGDSPLAALLDKSLKLDARLV